MRKKCFHRTHHLAIRHIGDLNTGLICYSDPDVNIFTFQLLEIIEVGLEGQEYVSLLSWMIQTYPGQDLMKSPSLGIPPEKIKPLLDQKVIDDLQVKYLKVCFLKIIFTSGYTCNRMFTQNTHPHGLTPNQLF